MKPIVGFIGLGLMGRPMVRNLLKAGHSVVVWNRTRSKSDELAQRGARVAANAREAAAAADVLFVIVSDPPALESVLWGEGALEALRKGSVLVDSSTVSPALERRIAEACTSAASNVWMRPSPAAPGARKRASWFLWWAETPPLSRASSH